MRSPFHSIVAGLLTTLALAGCGKKPSAPSPAPEEKPAAAGAVFVELIVEITHDNAPTPPLLPALIGPPRGYFLQEAATPPMLYAARGEAAPTAQGGLWTGLTVFDPSAHGAEPFRRLEILGESPAKVPTISQNVPPFLPNQGLATALRPALEAAMESDGETVKLSTPAATVKAGEVRLLAETKLEGKPEQWLADIEKSCAAAGQPLPGKAGMLLEALREMEKAHPHWTFRLWLHNHGPVAIGKVDLAREWKAANQAAVEARYADALAALENILRAMPDHEDSLLLMARIMALGDKNSITAKINGTVKFTAVPDAKLQAIFKTYGEGIAYLLPEGGDAREILFSATVQDGKFALTAPVGKYRLVVEAPGYKKNETPVSLQGDMNREIVLAK